MNCLRTSKSLSWLAVAALTVALTGCSGMGNASFPDSAVNASQGALGTMQGNVFGGHAPLVGSHVYVLQPGATGYGSQATSLLSATYQTNGGSPSTEYATHLNATDPNIPTSWYYQVTDATGAFNISGDYTCTAGHPVYLYAYGGSPTYPSASNTFAISSVTVTGTASPYTFTFTTTTTENAYIGEQVAISGLTGVTFTGTGNVIATNLTTTTFVVQSTTGTAGTYTESATAVFSPTFNPGVVNLAVLGICPSTGTLATGGTIFNGTTSNPIKYIYMNEVSTAAAAYALEGFALATPTATTNATLIGSSATNLIGIENAALNAAQLYDIEGSQSSTTYAGEGHIANPKTPAGNGSVPQNLLDTMGNILAACVDSNNTSTVDANAAESPQCKTLFETATSNGIPKGTAGAGIIPLDTAQAMLNIAQNPAGAPGSTSAFMTALYGLPTGNVPFTPNLSSTGAGQPNDFTCAIQYPRTFVANAHITSATSLTANTASANAPESIAIDGYGNVWMNNDATDAGGFYDVFEMTPLGVVTYTNATSTHKVGYVTVDPTNNVYAGSNYVAGDELEIAASGTVNTSATRTTYNYTGNYGTVAPFNADGFFNGYMSVADGAGNIYIAAAPPATVTGPTAQEYTLAMKGSANQTTPGTFASLFNPVSMGTVVGSIGAHGAVENASTNGNGYIWWSNEEFVGTTTNAFAFVRVNPTTGAVATGFPIQYSTSTTNNVNDIQRPEMPAIDQSGNMWAATQGQGALAGGQLLKVTQAGTLTAHPGSTLSGPFGLAIDGANNIFIGNRTAGTGTSIAEFSIANDTNLSPATNNYTLGGQLTGPLNIAMDQSGTLWIAAIGSNSIVEWIGAGAPLYNPLSLASKNNKVSTEP